MQKVSQSRIIHYPNTYLFIDDISSIMDIFKKNFDETELTIDNYKITDLSKISELKKQFATDLRIEAKPDYGKKDHRNGRMSLSLRNFDRSLYISDEDNAILLGIASQISEILRKRKSITRIFDFDWLSLIFSILGWLLVILLSHFYHFPDSVFYLFLIGITALILLIWFALAIRYSKKRVIIYLFESNSKTNFFRRKKDDILVALIQVLVGAIAGSLLTVLIEHLVNSKP